jgi:hypothetical protein
MRAIYKWVLIRRQDLVIAGNKQDVALSGLNTRCVPGYAFGGIKPFERAGACVVPKAMQYGRKLAGNLRTVQTA